jgi:1-acyl-sn-glycerol-3-phosphate acyltransferase
MPLDAMVLQAVVYDEIERHVRLLGADLVFKTPFAHDLARKIGTTLACQEDAERLLASDQIVGVFPEASRASGSCTRTATSCSGSAGAASSPPRSVPRCR